MEQFSIDDLERFSGIKKHTIRIWESRYSFLQCKRNKAFQRRYTTHQINVLLNAALLNQNGVKVSRIDAMCDEKKKAFISALEDRQLKAVHDLIIYMAEMDTDSFELVLDSCVHCFGIHQTIKEVMYPFAQRVGLLQKWMDKSYVENILLVKEIVIRKLHLGIDKAHPMAEKSKTVLLFLPAFEKQTLPLLFLNYFLKMEGYHVLNLGSHVTIESLQNIIERKKPHYCIYTLLEKPRTGQLKEINHTLPAQYPDVKFFSISSITEEEKGDNCISLPSIDALIQQLS